MIREELIEGLRTLSAPDQGMNYFGGGFDHDGPRFDTTTGERLSPRHRPATLHLHGDRARFIYRLIESSAALADELAPAQPDSRSGAGEVRERLQWPTGEFSVHDPDPSNDHSPIYLVCPTWGLMVDFSADPTPGLDAARVQWVADTLNVALAPAQPQQPDTLAQHMPDADWLARRIEADPDIEVEAGTMHPEAPDTLAEGLEVVAWMTDSDIERTREAFKTSPWVGRIDLFRDGPEGIALTPRAEATRLLAEARERIVEQGRRNAELSVLAYRWMVAHDRLQAGEPYDLPSPADLPAAEADAAKLREALTVARSLAANAAYNLNQAGITLDTASPARAFEDIERTAAQALAQTKGRP